MKANSKHLYLHTIAKSIMTRLTLEAQKRQYHSMQFNTPITPLYVTSGEYALLSIDIYINAADYDPTIVDSLLKGGYTFCSTLGPIPIIVKD